jgi:hypothetical protein
MVIGGQSANLGVFASSSDKISECHGNFVFRLMKEEAATRLKIKSDDSGDE